MFQTFFPGHVLTAECRGVSKNSRSTLLIYSKKTGVSQLISPDLATLICLGAVLLLAAAISVRVTWAYIKQQQMKHAHRKHAQFKKSIPSTRIIKAGFKNRLRSYRP